MRPPKKKGRAKLELACEIFLILIGFLIIGLAIILLCNPFGIKDYIWDMIEEIIRYISSEDGHSATLDIQIQD